MKIKKWHLISVQSTNKNHSSIQRKSSLFELCSSYKPWSMWYLNLSGSWTTFVAAHNKQQLPEAFSITRRDSMRLQAVIETLFSPFILSHGKKKKEKGKTQQCITSWSDKKLTLLNVILMTQANKPEQLKPKIKKS